MADFRASNVASGRSPFTNNAGSCPHARGMSRLGLLLHSADVLPRTQARAKGLDIQLEGRCHLLQALLRKRPPILAALVGE